MFQIRLLLLTLALFIGFSSLNSNHDKNAAPDPNVELLTSAGIETSDKALIRFLARKGHAAPADAQIAELIKQLGHDRFEKRESATAELISIGTPALPALGAGSKSTDPEISKRCRLCSDFIHREQNCALGLAASRILLARMNQGAAEAVVSYLAHVPLNSTVEVELWFRLYDAAKRNEAFLKSLAAVPQDKSAPKRALAAFLLGRLGSNDQKKLVRAILTDADPYVRLRASQGLLAGGSSDSVPALIALLQNASVEIAWQAEEMLVWAAGDSAPADRILKGDADSRKACRGAWATWWVTCKQSLRPGFLEQQSRPSLYLVFEEGPLNQQRSARIWLGGCDGRPRATMENLPNEYGTDQFLPSGMLLHRDAVYDLSGMTKVPGQAKERLLGSQALPTGNLILAERSRIQELTVEGQVVRKLDPGDRGHLMIACHGLPNGNLASLEENVEDRQIVVRELDWSGRVKNSGILKGVGLIEATKSRWTSNHCLLMRTALEVLCYDYLSNDVGRWRLACLSADITPTRSLLALSVVDANLYKLVELDSQGNVLWDTFVRKSGHLTIAYPLLGLGFDSPRSDLSITKNHLEYRISQLSSTNPLVRRGSAHAIGEIGEKGDRAIPRLVSLLEDEEKDVADQASEALRAIGKAVTSHLGDLFKKKDPRPRQFASATVGQYWPSTKAFLPQLIAASKDPDAIVRYSTVLSLEVAAGDDDLALRAIIDLLDDSSQAVRQYALIGLGKLGPRGKPAVSRILKYLDSKEPFFRGLAASTLPHIAPDSPAVIAGLVKVVEDKSDAASRLHAIKALGTIGSSARTAIPALKIATLDSDAAIQEAASAAIKNIKHPQQ